jgi:hypothetical protein
LREGIEGRFLESGDAAAEDELDVVREAVALLGDAEFCFSALFGAEAGSQEVRAVDEHDRVGVRLDYVGARPFNHTDHDNPPANRDNAGTPENFKSSVIPGARGKGGKNYTGSYSGSAEIE